MTDTKGNKGIVVKHDTGVKAQQTKIIDGFKDMNALIAHLLHLYDIEKENSINSRKEIKKGK